MNKTNITDVTSEELVSIFTTYLDSLYWEIKTSDSEEDKAFAIKKYNTVLDLLKIIARKYVEKNPQFRNEAP